MAIAKAPFVADELDHLLFATFPGLVIRKDLAQEIRGTSKAPSYVIEFMLGKYCSNLFDRLNPDVDGAGLLRPLDFDTGDDPLLQRGSAVKVAQSSIGTETGCTTGNGDTPFSPRSEPLRSAQFDLFGIG